MRHGVEARTFYMPTENVVVPLQVSAFPDGPEFTKADVQHWHAGPAHLEGDGDWDWTLTEDPDLAED